LGRNQVERQGLLKPGIDLSKLDIVELIAEHDIDTEIYAPIDTGNVEIRTVTETDDEGNETQVEKAFVLYDKKVRFRGDVRELLQSKVNARRDAICVSGYRFLVDGTEHTIQTRTELDLINWLGLKAEAEAAPSGTTMSLRTAENATLELPSEQVAALLKSAMAYRSTIISEAWSLKDSIKGAADDAEAVQVYEDNIDTIWTENVPAEVTA
jgi:hypothetical protein